MEKIKCLGRYQKVILLFMLVMVLVFTAFYCMATTREGYAYKNAILIPKQENETITYTGKIEGKQAVFTVSPDKIVEFHYGDKVYGPYTIKEDATAMPDENNVEIGMRGIELCCGNEVIFRGGVQKMDDFYWVLLNEDGSSANIIVEIEGIDEMEPSVSTILDLISGPELTHKGDWFVWFVGVAVCFITAYSIIFTDELFQNWVSFYVRNADNAEPSDWEVTRRYIVWAGCPIIVMILFIVGLQ